jgi:hypothetical protein
VVLVSYAPKLAAALSGATIRQLAHWRKPGPDGQAVLAPEYSATRPIEVIAGTRIPYDEVAALLRDGVAPEDIGEFFPQVSPAAARDAYDFASYVDSYVQPPEQAA